MPKIHVEVPFKLPTAEAVRRVKKLLSKTKAQFADKISDVREEWRGNEAHFEMKAMGLGVTGDVSVEEGVLVVDGELPFAATFLKAKIESTIRHEAAKLLS